MLKVAILDDYQNISKDFIDLKKLSSKYEFQIFNQPFENEDDAIEQLKEFEVLFIMRERTKITKQLIESLKKLKLIVTSGMRNKSIDLDTAIAVSKSIDLFLIPLVTISFNFFKLSINCFVIFVLSRIIKSTSNSFSCSIASSSFSKG